MTPGSRRLMLYWGLLLLPTLAVGGGVLWLLGREQARIDVESRAATEARRETVAARSRLIAENVEALVGDVQSGLMATLREAPADTRLEDFLGEWRRSNPLVRGTFYQLPDGRGVRAQGALDAAWFQQRLTQGEPWARDTNDFLAFGANGADAASRALKMSNGQKVNTARQELQLVAQMNSAPPAVAAPMPEFRAVSFAPERSGWSPLRDGGALHLLGWSASPGGVVVGVEVQLDEVAARLGGVLPEGREPGEVYQLREAGGALLQQAGLSEAERAIASGEALVKVPVSEAVLPGWEVVGFLAPTDARLAGGVLFTLSAVLAGLLVAAILAGGTLLARQARRSQEEAAQKTSFVANVSHEFKTPLTTIRLYAELLEQGRVADADKRADYLRTIGRETKRLARLVNNVLDFSRLEQGRKRFAWARVDVTAELSRMLHTHAPRVAEAGLELRRELPSDALLVTTDRDALEQILVNLLDNACKYAANGGCVEVQLSGSESDAAKSLGAVIRVADRGPGVPAEHREKIFEKFHRVDDALVAERTGAGLGLSIARQLARGLGGELTCEEREGAGAVFMLVLPKHPPEAGDGDNVTAQTRDEV